VREAAWTDRARKSCSSARVGAATDPPHVTGSGGWRWAHRARCSGRKASSVSESNDVSDQGHRRRGDLGARGPGADRHHPSVSIGDGYVDLKLVSSDAIYRDAEGTEHVVEWVTQQDVDLARRITEIAADHELAADPASVSVIELGLRATRRTPRPSPRCGLPC
jgi:hypothetical protein